MPETDYTVQTDYFSGPLDLLLHLIRRKRMDIIEVSITEITAEYLAYLEKRQGIDPSREGDFLMTAATLIYIKSRTLLPRLQEEDDETSPEQEFLHTLIEYDKIQKISGLLRELEEEELLFWARDRVSEDFGEVEYDLQEVSSFQLAEVFYHILRKKEKEDPLVVSSKEYSVEKKRREILEIISREGYLNFNEYIRDCRSLTEIIFTFFSILEILKQKLVTAVQKTRFGTISVYRREA